MPSGEPGLEVGGMGLEGEKDRRACDRICVSLASLPGINNATTMARPRGRGRSDWSESGFRVHFRFSSDERFLALILVTNPQDACASPVLRDSTVLYAKVDRPGTLHASCRMSAVPEIVSPPAEAAEVHLLQVRESSHKSLTSDMSSTKCKQHLP